MNNRQLQQLERDNNQGHASPADVQQLISAYRLVQQAQADRLAYDYDQANQARGAYDLPTPPAKRRNFLPMLLIAVIIAIAAVMTTTGIRF